MEENSINKPGHQGYEPTSFIPSGYFGNTKNNIVECRDFLTQEEKEKLTKFALSNTAWDVTETRINENGTVIYDANNWTDRVATSFSLRKGNPDLLWLINDMQNRLKVEVDKHFKVDAQATGPAVVRWPVGTGQMPHADKELHKGPDAGMPNAFPWYDIASIFYFNDDYEGGELYFPIQGVKFKPRAGSAYFFPGDRHYVHGVTTITSGTRFTSPFFWTIKEVYEEHTPVWEFEDNPYTDFDADWRTFKWN